MDIQNRKYRRKSQERIEAVFIELIQKKELNKITVAEICKLVPCNRSTFYANYLDVYDLADSIRQGLEEHYDSIFISQGEASDNYLLLFRHIKENMDFYKLYFKLGYDRDYRIFRYDKILAEKQFGADNKMIDYHCEFFRGGITMIRKTLISTPTVKSGNKPYSMNG